MSRNADDTTINEPAATEEHLLERVVQSAHEGIDALADTAAPHVQRFQEGLAVARDTGEEWAESVRCTVRQHPLAALAAAAALGMLVARLTR